MTNQTQIFSVIDSGSSGEITSLDGLVNNFITGGIALGYINFDVKQVIITTEYTGAPGLATGSNYYTVQVNYYDPSLY